MKHLESQARLTPIVLFPGTAKIKRNVVKPHIWRQQRLSHSQTTRDNVHCLKMRLICHSTRDAAEIKPGPNVHTPTPPTSVHDRDRNRRGDRTATYSYPTSDFHANSRSTLAKYPHHFPYLEALQLVQRYMVGPFPAVIHEEEFAQ